MKPAPWLQAAGIETIDVEDTNWTADTRGAPGEEVSLHLLLRMVADIGIVGLPNAGKSSLLACLTRFVLTAQTPPSLDIWR